MKLWLGIFVLICGLGITAWTFLEGNALSGGLAGKITVSDLQNYVGSGSEREYSWNQRVTLTIDTDEGPVSASSVMRVKWAENSPRINDARWTPSFSGEMPLARLHDGTYVLALAKNSRRDIAVRFLLSAESVGTWASGNDLETISGQNLISEFISPSDPRFPYLVRFTDISDPTSVEYFSPGRASITVEKIDDSVTESTSIEPVAPWVTELPNTVTVRMPTRFELPSGGRAAVYQQDIVRQ